MGNLKYLGTTFDNEKRKLWVKIRNDGEFTEARTRVEFYLEGGFQGSRQKDIKVAEGQTATGEFEYPSADVDTAKISITDARTGANIGTWSVELKETEVKYTLSGYVKDTEGNPINFATVEAFGVETKTTAANGYYKFVFDQGYSGEVTASKEGYKSQTKTITLTEGINNLNFELEEETAPPEEKVKIYGYVKDSDGNPIEGATVSSGGVNPVHTDSSGYYEYSVEPAVSIRIDVEKEGYASTSKWINVGTEDVRSDFTLTKETAEKHNKIYGTVIGKAIRIPIAGAQISFGGKTAFSDNEGKYEIKDVFASGPITCSATGYKTATELIEAPIEGDLEVNFELEIAEAPQIDTSPIAPSLQGMDKELSAANEIAKQQLDAAKTQGEIPEPAIETALRQVGLDDWADKYHEIYEWLNDTFGVKMPDPRDPTKKRKVIILTAGFASGLGALASKLGLGTAKGALTRAGGAIAATIGGLKASSILKGLTGIVGTVVFAEFICEEAVQTAGMGVYMASQTRDPEVVRQALENYKNILNATKQIHDTVKYIDPIGSTFEAFFVASENNITNYEKLIERLEDKEKEKMKEEIKELNRSLLDRLFIANLISEEDYRSRLKELGYTDADIDLLVELAETKKEVRVELLSKSDILKAYKEELIDEDTAKNKLRALNYTDEDIELMLNMSAKEKLGKLRVTSKPTHAQIIINDKPTNLLTSETMYLPAGTYAVTVSLEGYKTPAAKEVEVEEEKTAEVHFDLERMKIGYLYIRSRPSQAAIYINGVDTRLLTPQKFELEEGKYKIMLRYRGYEDREIEVDIKENETVEKYIRLVRKAE